MTWHVASADQPTMLLLHIINCQDAWRRLTRVSQAALLILAEDPAAAVHPATAKALRVHGLIDDDGVSKAARQVLEWGPDKEEATS